MNMKDKMSICEKIRDKILDFNDLNPQEQARIRAHLAQCESCRKHFQEINSIMTGLKQANRSSHVDAELLERYVVFTNSRAGEPDYDGSRLSGKEIAAVEKHLASCKACSKKMAAMTAEYNSLAQYLGDAGLPKTKIGTRPLAEKVREKVGAGANALAGLWDKILPAPAPRLIPLAVTAFAIALLVLLLPYLRSTTPGYADLAKISPEQIVNITRGAEDARLNQALLDFRKGAYPAAAAGLEKYIRENPSATDIAYTNYLCGLTYILEGNKNLSDGIEAVDQLQIDRGIQHLQAAAQLASSDRIEEMAYWYLGKAFLMKQDGNAAKAYFEKVIALKGRKSDVARQMLNNLQKILISGK